MFRPIVTFAMLASLSLHGTLASASPDQPITATAVSHGVRVSLSIPNRQCSLHALARFTVSVQNVSHSNRYLQDFQPDWGGPYSPHILMRSDGGRFFYEEDLSSFLAPSPGELDDNYVLQPGHARTWHVRFVLQGDNVQAVTRIADGYTAFSYRPGTPTPPRSAWAKDLWHIASPWVHLSLTREPAPAVRVTRSGSHIHVTVQVPWPASGPMFYMDSARCWTGKGTMSTPQDVPWRRARGHQFTGTLTSHCPSRQPWHAVVGWSNHRVAFISYANVATIH